MIMLDGSMFAAMLERCSDLFTGTADELFNIMADSEVMLSSWQGIAADDFRKALSAGCEDVMMSIHELSDIMVKIEDTAMKIAELKHRIGEAIS